MLSQIKARALGAEVLGYATIVFNRANEAERLNFKYRCELLHGSAWRAEWQARHNA